MPPRKKNLKLTKKFEKNQLKGVLEQRKLTAKIKQRQKLQEKQKSKRAKDAEFYGKDGEKSGVKANGAGKRKDARVSEMSVDDFFSGGFEMLEDAGGKSMKKGKQEATKTNKLGKRKRDDVVEEEEALISEGEDDNDVFQGADAAAFSDSDDSAGEDEDEDRGMSKQAMDELAAKDPEFYKFLKETDPEALDFDENADLAEVDALSEGGESEQEKQEEEEKPKKKRKKEKEKEAKKAKVVEKEEQEELTSDMVARWKKSMIETKSLRAARRVVLGFRCAVHLNEDDVQGDAKKQRFTINSPQVYNDVVVTALTYVPEVLHHHLPSKESSSGKVYVQNESQKFKGLSTMLKTYTASLLHLLGVLADEKTLKLTISSIEPLLPYLLSFRKLLKALVKKVVHVWAQLASSETVQITAFLILRRLVVIGDKSVGELVVKTGYQALLSSCRVIKHNTLPSINLLKNMGAELWGIVDPSTGYTTAFTFIRQLAMHLRNSFNTQKKDAVRIVYNWQFTHSLDFWSIVVSEHCNRLKEAEAGKESHFRPLIYPLVMITLGTMDKIPSAKFFPLKFHLVRSCLRISRATGTYIPMATPLLEVFNAKEMKNKPIPSRVQEAFDFTINYRAPDSVVRTRPYQDGVAEQTVELLSEFFLLWAKSVAFPELSLPVVIHLKRKLKQDRKKASGSGRGKGKGKGKKGVPLPNTKMASAIAVLVQKLEANAKFIEGHRNKVDFAPSDRAQVAAFLSDLEIEKTPLGAYVMAQRKVRAEKARLLEEARAEDEKRRKEEAAEKKNKETDDMVLDSDDLDDEEVNDGEEDSDDDVDGDDDLEEDDDEEEGGDDSEDGSE